MLGCRSYQGSSMMSAVLPRITAARPNRITSRADSLWLSAVARRSSILCSRSINLQEISLRLHIALAHTFRLPPKSQNACATLGLTVYTTYLALLLCLLPLRLNAKPLPESLVSIASRERNIRVPVPEAISLCQMNREDRLVPRKALRSTTHFRLPPKP